jgi:CRISPR-associated endonuclease/helicase Cas3
MTATPNSSIIEILDKEKFKHSFVNFKPTNGYVQNTKATSDIFVELLEKNITENTDKIIEICLQNKDQDIVIISDSLKRIVQLNLELRKKSINCGLITGPMSKEERQEALNERIILATPTVDIGINFKKPFKQRQTVDVIIFEANSSDSFIQRIGRAGRILGKKLQNFPSYAYCIMPSSVAKRISSKLDSINTRLELNKLVSEEFRSHEIEEFKKIYSSPYRMLLGLYEDAVKLIFPEDIVKEKIEPYFEKIEKTLGLTGISNKILRKQLNLYHIAEIYFSKEENINEKDRIIRKLIKPLEEDITNLYFTQQEFEKALYSYMEFIKKYILSFRSSSGEKIYVLDEEKITGTREFLADVFIMITQYNLEKIEVPKNLKNQVLGAYKILSPRDKNLKLDFNIQTKAEQGFVIPIKIETGMIEGTKSIKFIGMPIYILDPAQEGRARKYGLKVYNITINGFVKRAVLGVEAIQAQAILSNRPWDYKLFPL